MEISDAMEAGWKRIGKQCYGEYWPDALATTDVEIGLRVPTECCALGAAIVGGYRVITHPAYDYIKDLNDNNKMTIPEIIEVLRGMGL